jgi:hypothetical protein
MTADNPLTGALASRYPDLTDDQRRKLEDAIVHEAATAIERGDTLATIVPLPGGSFELSFITVERTHGYEKAPE